MSVSDRVEMATGGKPLPTAQQMLTDDPAICRWLELVFQLKLVRGTMPSLTALAKFDAELLRPYGATAFGLAGLDAIINLKAEDLRRAVAAVEEPKT
jgi:hypothetical protein